MHLLSHEESASATDGFLLTIYGEEILRKWKELKEEMEFVSEREYMSWLIDVAYQYRAGDEGVMATDEAGHTTYEHDEIVLDGDKEDVLNHTERQNLFVTQDNRRLNVKTESGEISYPVQMQNEPVNTCHSQAQGLEVVSRVAEASDEIYLSPGQGNTAELDTTHHEGHVSVVGVATDKPGSARVSTGSSVTQLPLPLYVQGQNFYSHEQTNPSRGQDKRKNYNCPHCGYICSQLPHLHSHLIRKHDYDSKYICQWCRKKQPTPSALRTHEEKCRHRGQLSIH